MTPRALVRLGMLLVLAAPAGSAVAAVTLQSAQLTSGSGHNYQSVFSPPDYQPTTYGPPVPFPNDALNFAGVGPDGLQVKVNRLARASYHLGNSLVQTWTAEKFEVVFRLDEPTPLTFHRSFGGTDDSIAVLTLQAQGQPPVAGLPLIGDRSGILPAGLYTFSGVMDYEGFGGAGARDISVLAGFSDLRLTVAPEPGALGLLAAPMLLLRRRR